MKCPSCGYENQEGSQYCNMCLHSFVRPEPEPRPKRLQPQTTVKKTLLSRETQKVK